MILVIFDMISINANDRCSPDQKAGGELVKNHKICTKTAPKNPKNHQLFGSGGTNG